MRHSALNVLVTGGGTAAPIDDVRVIANVSTGRFSSEITEAFLERGARVWHLCAAGAQRPFRRLARFELDAPSPVHEFERLSRLRERWLNARDRLTIRVLERSTVTDYAGAMRELVGRVAFDVIVLAMAVSDYEPRPVSGKIGSDAEELLIRCRRTPKVIREIRAIAPAASLVGFKLLSGTTVDQLVTAASRTLRDARADWVVANDLQLVHTDRHAVHLVHPDGHFETIGPGTDIATKLVARLIELTDRARANPSRLDES